MSRRVREAIEFGFQPIMNRIHTELMTDVVDELMELGPAAREGDDTSKVLEPKASGRAPASFTDAKGRQRPVPVEITPPTWTPDPDGLERAAEWYRVVTGSEPDLNEIRGYLRAYGVPELERDARGSYWQRLQAVETERDRLEKAAHEAQRELMTTATPANSRAYKILGDALHPEEEARNE